MKCWNGFGFSFVVTDDGDDNDNDELYGFIGDDVDIFIALGFVVEAIV